MASRSPAPGVGYDQSLLAAAPEVTKADKQEGYNPDLLEQGTPTRGPTSRRTPVSLPANGNYNGSDESNGLRKTALPAAAPATKGRPKKLVWIIGGIVLLVIIAIAVGVGVGVGAKKNNGNNVNIGQGGPNIGSDPNKPTDTANQGSGTASQDPGDVKPTDQGAVSPSGVNGVSQSAASTDENGAPIPRQTFG